MLKTFFITFAASFVTLFTGGMYRKNKRRYPDDWQPVFTELVFWGHGIGKGDQAIYKAQYSLSRDRYRLLISGTNPKKHIRYKAIKKRYNELKKIQTV